MSGSCLYSISRLTVFFATSFELSTSAACLPRVSALAADFPDLLALFYTTSAPTHAAAALVVPATFLGTLACVLGVVDVSGTVREETFR